MQTLRPLSVGLFPLVAALLGAGCGSSDGGGETGTTTEPLYAMMVQVYATDGDRTVYTYLSNTLDIDASIDLADAREFPGVANFAPVGGNLLISSGTAPSITAFRINDDFEWQERETISFLGFPFEDNANFYYQYVVDADTVFMPYEETKRILWNPTTMEITDTIEESDVPAMDGAFLVRTGGNRNAIRFNGPVQQPFFYTDENWENDGPESIVAIYDEETFAEDSLVTIACPGLSMASQDEDGRTYYGTWGFSVNALFGIGPSPCIARLNADNTLDTDFTTDLFDITEGRHHNNFRYIGDGKAIANVLHTELIPDADFENGFDQDLADLIYSSGPHWKLWLIDIEAGTGAPIDGIDVEIGSGAQFAVLDGRTFLFAPYDEWARTKIYELLNDGTAVEHSDTLGDVFKWVRVR